MLREDGTGAIEYFYGKIGEVTKTRRTMIVPNQAIATYVTQWTYDSISVPIYATTPCGSPRGDGCSATHKGSRGVGMGCCTSVTASRMTDAYGASTPAGVLPSLL